MQNTIHKEPGYFVKYSIVLYHTMQQVI